MDKRNFFISQFHVMTLVFRSLTRLLYCVRVVAGKGSGMGAYFVNAEVHGLGHSDVNMSRHHEAQT